MYDLNITTQLIKKMTQSQIRVLDDVTINKIAAGEVVVNVYSVVKECVENSLDAGASDIRIELHHGGIKEIKIIDNGIGMSPTDARLCFKRHATSKLQTFDNMSHLQTMGFRGEALAAISAVSKVNLHTSDSVKTTNISCVATDMNEGVSVRRNQGTTISIKDIFFNLAPRRSLLNKSPKEVPAIKRLIETFAMVHPDVSFRLAVDNKQLLLLQKLAEYDLHKRVRQVLPHDEFNQLKRIGFAQDGIDINGYYSTVHAFKHNRNNQFLFINKRILVSKDISNWIKEAYGGAVPARMHPQYVLFLNLPSASLDVNIHPQKKEVDFYEIGKLKRFIKEAFQEHIYPNVSENVKTFNDIVSFAETAYKENKHIQQPINSQTQLSIDSTQEVQTYISNEDVIENDITAYWDHFVMVTKSVLCKWRGRVKHDSSQELILLDMKQIFMRLMVTSTWDDSEMDHSQLLLVPIVIQCGFAEREFLRSNETTLESVGFTIRWRQDNSAMITRIPNVMSDKDVKKLFANLFQTIEKNINKDELVLYLSKSRESSFKINSMRECVQLISAWLKLSQPFDGFEGCSIAYSLDRETVYKKLKKVDEL
jgi:DNA mismatch repair protein MutL